MKIFYLGLTLIAFPLVALANQNVIEEGVVSSYFIDSFDKEAKQELKLKTSKGEFKLDVKGKSPDLLSGSRVKVRGEKSGDQLSVQGNNIEVKSEATLSSISGPRSFLVLMVNFSDNQTQPFSLEEINSQIFNNVNGFYKENSYDTISFIGEVKGYYTLTTLSANCNMTEISSQAREAAELDGINTSLYQHIMYVFPRSNCITNGYAWTGYGMYGGAPAEAWINGSSTLMVFSHELGHNLGLRHSHGCESTITVSYCSVVSEYGDKFDTMGSGYGNHFNAYQKIRLGWLGQAGYPSVKVVSQSGTYKIGKIEFSNTLPLAIQITKSRVANYYIEKRSSIGYDTGISGVVLHSGLVPGVSGYTPNFELPQFGVLKVGQTFIDSAAKVSIKLLSETVDDATLEIKFLKGK